MDGVPSLRPNLLVVRSFAHTSDDCSEHNEREVFWKLDGSGRQRLLSRLLPGIERERSRCMIQVIVSDSHVYEPQGWLPSNSPQIRGALQGLVKPFDGTRPGLAFRLFCS
jgi:hypothetical protein